MAKTERENLEKKNISSVTPIDEVEFFKQPEVPLNTILSNGDLQNCADFYSKEIESQHHSDFGDLIFEYTRTQAIADGVLFDVSKLAAEAGFKYPVAMSDTAWFECVAVPDQLKCQDETGRLWDVLMMLRFALKAKGRQGDEISFVVSVQKSQNKSVDTRLKALCHPGDNAEPVITILLPGED